MLSLSKHLCRLLIVVSTALCFSFIASASFARSRNRSGTYQTVAGIDQLDAALTSNDVESAQAIATTLYQQATNAPALTSTDPTVIIDPVLAAQSAEFTRT